MSILSRIFGSKSGISAKPVEHAVIVTFAYIGSTDLDPLFALESQLKSAISAARVGMEAMEPFTCMVPMPTDFSPLFAPCLKRAVS
jgi:hypothetical protein